MGSEGSPQPFQGVHKAKTIFLIIQGCYLAFSLSFSYKRAVEFSRGYMTHNVAKD